MQFRRQFNMIAGKNTTEKRTPVAKPTFWNNTKRYYDLKSYWINRFGCRVHKLPIDAGFTCPNRDGSVAAGGCIYCDGRGSALRQAGPLPSVGEQVRRGKAFYRRAREGGEIHRLFPDLHEHLRPGGERCGRSTTRRSPRRT